MPKEHKKRGRREEKKRKRDAEDDTLDPKRARLAAHEDVVAAEGSQDEVMDGVSTPGEMPFYGMLDEEEQEYFKRADEMLELNQFDSPEERDLFLENVYKEADGKELKIANSQSCSRLMERLILLSTPKQLKSLFQKFSGQYVSPHAIQVPATNTYSFSSLVQHRFASHCCEALFLHAAPFVTQSEASEGLDYTDPNEVYVSMEDLFIHTIHELEGNLGFLLTDRFGSHTLRVLLTVLSGQPLAQASGRTLLKSKRKEKIGVNGVKTTTQGLENRPVPASFTTAMESLISTSMTGLDTTYLRALATHKTGNPTLQLLIQLELTQFGKQHAKDEASIIRRLLPDDPIAEGTESANFIQGMLYDQIGSHLMETIIEFAPGKLFKQLYRDYFKERIGSLARNEVASYVACKILERLNKEDLEDARDQILKQIPNLVERNRTLIIKTIIERSNIRGVETAPIASALEAAYSGPHGFEITRLLKVNEGTGAAEPSDSSTESNGHHHHHHHHHDPAKVHCCLLAQTMLASAGPLSALILTSLLSLPPALLVKLSMAAPTSQVLQAALTSPEANTIFRRKIIQSFYGQVGSMALDPYASHVIDAIWRGTSGLAFIRERIAEELAENEGALRESKVGRVVWRNWNMDLYKRRRGDWVKMCRSSAGNDGFMSFPNDKRDTTEDEHEQARTEKKPKVAGRHMTALEAARQKHFAEKQKKEKMKLKKEKRNRTATAVNSEAILPHDRGKQPLV